MAARFLQLHLLTPFAPSNLNRDDLGRPKTAFMGGVERVRISSQCMKRSLRLSDEFKVAVKDLGTRTRYLREYIEATLIQQGWTEDKAAKLTKALLSINKISGSGEDKKDQTVMYNRAELQKLDTILSSLQPDEELYAAITSPVAKGENAKGKGKGKGKDKSAAPEVSDGAKSELCKNLNFIDTTHCSVDVALFGRMVAKAPQLDIEAASCFSHAITTHRVSSSVDFFTAVDDEASEDTKGGGHLGSLEYTSGTYYRYVSLDLGLLAASIGNDEDLMRAVLGFTKALYVAIPAARQKTLAGQCPWSYAHIFIRKGQGTQLTFEKPVKSDGNGYLEPSIEAMENELSKLRSLMGSLFGNIADFSYGIDANYSIDSLCNDIETSLNMLD